MPSYKPVTSVLRGLEVLRVINRTMPTTVKELHYETGFDKATIVRMLETLIQDSLRLMRGDRAARKAG